LAEGHWRIVQEGELQEGELQGGEWPSSLPNS
jgi:hypothetical protein